MLLLNHQIWWTIFTTDCLRVLKIIKHATNNILWAYIFYCVSESFDMAMSVCLSASWLLFFMKESNKYTLLNNNNNKYILKWWNLPQALIQICYWHWYNMSKSYDMTITDCLSPFWFISNSIEWNQNMTDYDNDK